MVERGHIDAPSMMASWAGAMGQPQFMPSSYLTYAVDFDGDGRRDIWTSPADTSSVDRQLSARPRLAGRRAVGARGRRAARVGRGATCWVSGDARDDGVAWN